MSYKRVQKRRKRRKIISLLVVFLIAYLFLKPVIGIISGGFKTTLPSEELLVESLKGEGFFIRSEKVVKSDVKGTLKKTVDEGDRISAGSEVASIHSLKDNSSLEREIIEIEQTIASLEKSETKVNILENEKNNIEDLRKDKIEEIQNKIIDKDYSDISIAKEELILYEQKQNDVNFSGTLANESLENLKIRKEKITQEINTNNIKFYTQNAGIISYEIDDYESIYIPKDFENYTYEKLDSRDYLKNDNTKKDKENGDVEISIGQPIYKLVDKFEWFVAIKVDNIKDIIDLDVNRTIKLKLKINNENIEIKGNIININKSNNKAVIVVKFNDMMYKLYDTRISMVELIKSEINTLKIPKKSVTEKDGQSGVYIKNKGGIVEFKPIFKIKEVGEYVYIKTGDNSSNVYIENDSKPIRTITLFDEIMLNTKSVKEGDIIN